MNCSCCVPSWILNSVIYGPKTKSTRDIPSSSRNDYYKYEIHLVIIVTVDPGWACTGVFEVFSLLGYSWGLYISSNLLHINSKRKIGQFVLMPCEWNEFKRHSCTWEMFIYCLTNMGELIKMVCSYLWKTGDWVLKLLFKSSCIWQQNFMINLSAYLVRVHPQVSYFNLFLICLNSTSKILI